jgi:hypothetical protein
MFSKKQLIQLSVLLALIFHFIFYFNEYGPGLGFLQNTLVFLFAFGSILIIIFVYFATHWRVEMQGKPILWVYELFILWILICFVRSMLEINSTTELKQFLLSNYMGISLFPAFFFIAGINKRYFYTLNVLLFIYLVVATIVSLFFLRYFELQLFLLFPIFYLIVTIPMRATWEKLFILLVSISIVVFSLTNRAGVLRILLSYSIVMAYFVMHYLNIKSNALKILVFCILLIPLISLYLGVKGQSIFQMTLGQNEGAYSQLDPYADTRTFLYYEVFQDLSYNKAFLLGKGMNAGYLSEAFQTYSRPVVEVSFLQVILKTGIIGFLLYVSIIVSAIFKAIGKAKNLFIKSLGLLLASYLIMMFIENQIAYNLLNVVIWLVVGMCHSDELRGMDDKTIRSLFIQPFSKFSKGLSDQ